MTRNFGNRRSICLSGYDYASAGAYFITIVTRDRQCVFGDIKDGMMCLKDTGHAVTAVWDALSTVKYIRGVRSAGWPPFQGALWQRNYYEQIIRTESSLNEIRRYIGDNPAQWPNDENNPTRRGGPCGRPDP